MQFPQFSNSVKMFCFHRSVFILVFSLGLSPILAKSNETICNAYNSCTECVTSQAPCLWCIDKNTCTTITDGHCRYDLIITGVSNTKPSYRFGPEFCPAIRANYGETPEILVPAGGTRSIRIRGKSISTYVPQSDFECHFDINGKVTKSKAQLLDFTFFCDAAEFYPQVPDVVAKFNISWTEMKEKESRWLDNPDGVHLLIYDCSLLADTCKKCKKLKKKYRCGWNYDKNQCDVKENCVADSFYSISKCV